jgi:hypothetical protein
MTRLGLFVVNVNDSLTSMVSLIWTSHGRGEGDPCAECLFPRRSTLHLTRNVDDFPCIDDLQVSHG